MDDAELDEITREECIALLRRCTVGRVAVEVPGTSPLVVPVNYVIESDEIVFGSDAGAKLSAVERVAMSFQIDDIDHGRHAGWSVLVRGAARVASAPESHDLELESWLGPRSHWVRLTMDEITGRRIVTASLPPDTRGYR